jgi:hypothetical protein
VINHPVTNRPVTNRLVTNRAVTDRPVTDRSVTKPAANSTSQTVEVVSTPAPTAQPDEVVQAGGSWPVLDTGLDIGALIVHAHPDDDGGEIHICPSGQPDHRSHNVVRERRVADIIVFAAVFPSLLAGEYRILPRSRAEDGQVIAVKGGMVSQVQWSPQPQVPQQVGAPQPVPQQSQTPFQPPS